MPEIMSSFIFQNSRRQILAYLSRTFMETSHHRDEHIERGEPEDDVEKRRIDNLLNAVKAADEQVKRLEYWSDVKDVALTGVGKEGSDETPDLHHQWQGATDPNNPSDKERSPKARHTGDSDLPHDVISSRIESQGADEPSSPSAKGKEKE